jgi:hypothetical protein
MKKMEHSKKRDRKKFMYQNRCPVFINREKVKDT